MTDPEIAYRTVVSGDPGAIRGHAESLTATLSSLDTAGDAVVQAAAVPVWTGLASLGFRARAAGIRDGIGAADDLLARARGALETAAHAYDDAVADADFYISFWRNRPDGLNPVVEELLARIVNSRLLAVGTAYSAQLAGITGVLDGDDVDLDELDAETREWVERGLDRNRNWMEGNDSGLGPLIPNTQATGDDRGWIPQGLGYDPSSGLLLQGYYTKDEGDLSSLSLIDEASGLELNQVNLGGEVSEGGTTQDYGTPSHAGGVTVDGDHVYVTSDNQVWTYSLSEMRNAGSGAPVNPTAPPQSVSAGSYTAFADGTLYVGDHYGDQLYAYEKDPSGQWQPVTGTDGSPVVIETPPSVQGVVVRDGEFVFSTSSGRESGSSLVVQDAETGERGDPYPMPNMSQGVVEADGDLITTYESGAGAYSEPTGDADDLWANPHMTRTPLGELGLSEELTVEPGTLRSAAHDLLEPADALKRAASHAGAVAVQAHQLGDVPAAGRLSSAVNGLLTTASTSLRTGSGAIQQLSQALLASANDYEATDQGVGHSMDRLAPR